MTSCKKVFATVLSRPKALFTHTWGWIRSGDPVRHRDDLLRLLELADDILRKHGLPYWIDYGVLLGAVRHGELVLWDYDLDLAFPSDAFRKLLEIMPHEALPPGHQYSYDPLERYARIDTDRVWVDFVEYQLDEKSDLMRPNLRSFYADPSNRDDYCPPIPRDHVMPIAQYSIRGRNYPGPKNADAYLRIVYGDYWQPHYVPLLYSLLRHPILTLSFMRNTRARKAAARSRQC